MENGASNTNDSNDFMNKVKSIWNIDIPNDALLVTADVAGLYPSITHKIDLKALRNDLEKRNYKLRKTD